jgi:hypothetical protein
MRNASPTTFYKSPFCFFHGTYRLVVIWSGKALAIPEKPKKQWYRAVNPRLHMIFRLTMPVPG